jgi:hypothetical protein
MTRGFVWASYIDDQAVAYAVRVDADYFADLDRGWTPGDPLNQPQLARGWKPRRVLGLDEDGNLVHALAGSVDAPIWNGDAPTFTFNGTDQLPHTARIIARQSEKRLG